MNATCDPCSASNGATKELYVLIVTVINLVLTLVVPYMFKLRPVQRVLHPRRLEHKMQLRGDLAHCIASMQQLAKTLSEKSESSSSDGKNSPKRIDTLVV